MTVDMSEPTSTVEPEADERQRRVLRPAGLAVFTGVVLLAGLVWWLFVDTLVQRGVERAGTTLVGARVELAAVDVRPTEGRVRLVGLRVTNPDRPMTNLLEAEELVGDLMLTPLLRKKVVIEQLSATGLRFNTERETSGALERPSAEDGVLWQQVNGWADQLRIPELSLENLGGAVRTASISEDSLATVRYAREVLATSDSLRSSWEAALAAVDPTPRLDSLRAVLTRMEGFRLTPLNAVQLPGLVRDGRTALEQVTRVEADVRALDGIVREGLPGLDFDQETLARLRAEDLRYARGLLAIPSLDAPTVSPALFGGTALVWLKPVLYWAQAAERFMPPGLDPRNRPGPTRVRAEGTTFDFRGGADYPGFLLQQGDLSLVLGGDGRLAGSYSARIQGLTSSPAQLGEPMRLSVQRSEGVDGPQELTLAALLDHTGDHARDSVALSLSGVGLPSVRLDRFGGTLALGEGETTVLVLREGDRMEVQMRWVSGQPRWLVEGEQDSTTRVSPTEDGIVGSEASSADLPIGSDAWASEVMRRALTNLTSVEVDMALVGSLQNPELHVSSNLGEAVAVALRQEVGQEVRSAEARVRTEIDELVAPRVASASRGVDEAIGLAGQISGRGSEVAELRARIEARLAELVRG